MILVFNAKVTGAGAPAEGTKSGTLLATGWPCVFRRTWPVIPGIVTGLHTAITLESVLYS